MKQTIDTYKLTSMEEPRKGIYIGTSSSAFRIFNGERGE